MSDRPDLEAIEKRLELALSGDWQGTRDFNQHAADDIRSMLMQLVSLREQRAESVREKARILQAVSQTQMFKREQAFRRRIKQMEEALRRLIASIAHAPDEPHDRVEAVEALDQARAALSPSDTEEEA
jgi:ribosomal 50S subunit-associated protein YjgA (DUF615 family)